MPDFNLTITMTDEQLEKVQRLFIIMNEQLVDQGKPPYPNIKAMAEDALFERIRAWWKMADAARIKSHMQLYEASTDALRDAADAALLPGG